jgi:hypothetical protein
MGSFIGWFKIRGCPLLGMRIFWKVKDKLSMCRDCRIILELHRKLYKICKHKRSNLYNRTTDYRQASINYDKVYNLILMTKHKYLLNS